MQDTLSYSLLGPIAAHRGDTVLNLGPPKRRVLLTRLLVAGDEPVSAEQLCHDVWKGSPSTGALSTLHSHISRLRAILEPERVKRAGATLLTSGPGGYSLRVAAGSLDTRRFESSVQEARSSLALRDIESTRRSIRAAEILWRGAPLFDATTYAFAAVEINRLLELRRLATESETSLLLLEGRYEEAIMSSESLTRSAPMHEAPWTLLMRALYAAGRSVDALQAYDRYRRLLASSLGLDPGPALSALHLAILRHDSAAVWGGESAPPGLVSKPDVGRSLVSVEPAGPSASLPGRSEELARLRSLLGDAASPWQNQWVVVSGEQGIGKSRLVEEFAEHATEAGYVVGWARFGQALVPEEERIPFRHLNGLFEGLHASTFRDPEVLKTARTGPVRDGLTALKGELRHEDWLLQEGRSVDQVATALASRIAQQPTVCIFEDLHLTNSSVLRVLSSLHTLVRDHHRVILIITVRDLHDANLVGLAVSLARQGSMMLPLAPLSRTDVRAWLDATGLGGLKEQAAALHRRSDGNPYVLTELLKLPQSRRGSLSACVPPAVGSILRERLTRFTSEELSVLATAAAAGEEIDIELLYRVTGLGHERLLMIVDKALTLGLLRWVEDRSDGGPGRYVYRELAREVIMGDITPVRRQFLHAALARALATFPERHPSIAALHFKAAGAVVSAEQLITAQLRVAYRYVEDDHPEAAFWFAQAAESAAHSPNLRDEALRGVRELA